MNIIPEDLFYSQENRKREEDILISVVSEPAFERAITSKLAVPFFFFFFFKC